MVVINKQSIKEKESVKQKEIKEKTIESSNTTDKENAMMIKIKHLEEERIEEEMEDIDV